RSTSGSQPQVDRIYVWRRHGGQGPYRRKGNSEGGQTSELTERRRRQPVAALKYKRSPSIITGTTLHCKNWQIEGALRMLHNVLEQKGLIMFGQMTAGSWAFIGTQGILQGTYETLAAAAREHFGGSLKGRIVLTAGLGEMGGAQPLAITMNDGIALAVEMDRHAIERRLKHGFVEKWTDNLDEAIDVVNQAKREHIPVSIALLGNAAEVHPELVRR